MKLFAFLTVFICLVGGLVLFYPSEPSQGQIDPLDSELMLVLGNSIQATVPISLGTRNLGEIVQAVIMCESSGRHNIWGDLNYTYPAFGIAQFQERTFYWMAEKANLNNPNWKSEWQQVWLLEWAIDNGYGKYWTCYRNLLRH